MEFLWKAGKWMSPVWMEMVICKIQRKYFVRDADTMKTSNFLLFSILRYSIMMSGTYSIKLNDGNGVVQASAGVTITN